MATSVSVNLQGGVGSGEVGGEVGGEVQLMLGDTIRFDAPTNPSLHKTIFFIFYIDRTMMKLFDVEDANDDNETVVTIDGAGKLGDKSVEGVEVLDRSPLMGYAEQNGLMPGVWVDIYFSGKVPLVVTGEILTKPNDMIELRSYPKNELLYIDFAYQGIPENLPIEKIVIRDKIDRPMDAVDAVDTVDTANTPSPGTATTTPTTTTYTAPEFSAVDGVVEFGPRLGRLAFEVAVEEKYRKYGLDDQLDDMLNDVMAGNDPAQIKDVGRAMTRYTQLREDYSEWSPGGDVVKYLYRGIRHRPLVQWLVRPNAATPWIIPVVRHTGTRYAADDTNAMEIAAGVGVRKMKDAIESDRDVVEGTTQDGSVASATSATSTRYFGYMSDLARMTRPFEYPSSATYAQSNLFSMDNLPRDMDVRASGINANFSEVRVTSGTLKSDSFFPNKARERMTGSSGASKSTYAPYMPSDKVFIESLLVMPSNFAPVATNILEDIVPLFARPGSAGKHSIDTKVIDMMGNRAKNGNRDMERSTITRYVPKFKDGVHSAKHGADEYKRFLELVVPATVDILKNVGTGVGPSSVDPDDAAERPYLLSIKDVMKRIAHYQVNQEDISYAAYREIANILGSEHKRYNKNFTLTKRKYDKMGEISGKHGGVRDIVSNLVRIIAKDSAQDIQESMYVAYGFDVSVLAKTESTALKNTSYALTKPRLVNMSGPEIIAYMNRIDGMRLFYATVRIAHANLATGNPQDDIKKLKTKLEILLNGSGTGTGKGRGKGSTDKCSGQVIAKHYGSKEDMERDNEVVVYYDADLDPTQYDVFRVDKKKQSELGKVGYRGFLANKIAGDRGISVDGAEIEADAILLGKRLVRAGAFAVVGVGGVGGAVADQSYFVRDEHEKWVKHNDVPTCVEVDDVMAKSTAEKIRGILKTYDADFEERMESIESDMKRDVDGARDYVVQRVRFLRDEVVGKGFMEPINACPVSEDPNGITAPTGTTTAPTTTTIQPIPDPEKAALWSKITGQPDLSKRANDTIRFVQSMKLRTSVGDESEYWYYCSDTGAKMVPTFMVRLAETFVVGGNYASELDRICAEQGSLSDDGDEWVDRHSGQTIKSISYNSDADYAADGGARGVLRDLEEVEDGGHEVSRGTGTAAMILRVLQQTASLLGLDAAPHADYVARNAELLLKQSVPEGAEVKVHDKLLVLSTLSFFLVSIQTSVPPVKSRKSFPGCKKSFSGFPFNGGTDMAGIEYMACVANKVRVSEKSQRPWNVISGKSLLKNLAATVKNGVVITAEYKKRAEDRIAHGTRTQIDGDQDQDQVPATHGTMEILPNQLRQNIPPTPVATSFGASVKRNLRSGGPRGGVDYYVIKEKAAIYANGIQKLVQDIVRIETLALRTSLEVPFLENACCGSQVKAKNHKRTLEYFVKKNRSIESYDTVVRDMDALVHDINLLRRAPYLLDVRNTKNSFLRSVATSSYSDSVKARLFITYCATKSTARICPEDMVKRYGNVSVVTDKLVDELVDDASGAGVSDQTVRDMMGWVRNRNSVAIGSVDTVDAEDVVGAEDVADDKDGTGTRAILYGGLEVGDDDPVAPTSVDTSVVEAVKRVVRGTASTAEGDIRKAVDSLVSSNERIRDEIVSAIGIRRTRSGAGARSNGRTNARATTHTTHTTHTTTRQSNSPTHKFLETLRQFSVSLVPKEREAHVASRPDLYRFIAFTQLFVQHMTQTFPASIANEVVRENKETMDLPVHWTKSWKMSSKHTDNMKAALCDYYGSFDGLCGDATTETICGEIRDQYGTLVPLLAVLEENAWFDGEVVRGLCENLILTCMRMYVQVEGRGGVGVGGGVGGSAGVGANTTGSNVSVSVSARALMESLEEDGPDGTDGPTDGTGVLQTTLRRKSVRMMEVFLGPMIREYAVTTYRYQDMAREMRGSREAEKDVITANLKNLSAEMRRVEDQKKELRLGRWNVGMQKGLTQYVGATYDAETEAIDVLGAVGVLGGGEGGVGVDTERDLDVEEAMDMSGLVDDDGDSYGVDDE
jgi:hypothetical protein